MCQLCAPGNCLLHRFADNRIRQRPDIKVARGSGISFLGNLSNNNLSEASGIVAPRRRADVLWVINDSGNGPLIMPSASMDRTAVTCPFERPQSGLGRPRRLCLQPNRFSADRRLRRQRKNRKSCVLYIVKEPSVNPAGIVEKAPLEWSCRIEYVYADGPRDCEGVAVDVQRREILLLTKRDEPPVLYSLPLTFTQSDKVQTARPVTRVGGIPKPTAEDFREDPLFGRFRSQPTAMDISPDGKIIAILTYKRPYLFYRQKNESWPRVFDRPPVPLDMPRMRQAEAISFSTDGTSLIVTSEKLPAPLYRLDIKP